MSNNQHFTVYTKNTSVSAEFPFHISYDVVGGEDDEFVKLVSCEHSHEFMQMLYVSKGRVMNDLQGRQEICEAGDIIIVPALVRHRSEYYAGAELYTISFMPGFVDTGCQSHFHIDRLRHISRLYLEPFLRCAKDSSLPWLFHVEKQSGAVVEEIYQQFRAGEDEAMLATHALFLRLLHQVRLAFVQAVAPVAPGLSTDQSQIYRQRIEEIVRQVQKNYTQDLQVEPMIRESGMSATYFRSFFKQVTGKTFTEYLNEVRIYNAVMLIKRTDLRLKEIAGRVGYGELQNFYRAFKKIIGTSPRSFVRNEKMH